MYYHTPQQGARSWSVAQDAAEHSGPRIVCQCSASAPPDDSTEPLPTFTIEEFSGETFSVQPEHRDVKEQTDWTNKRANREFIKLEQKVLAKKATPAEQAQYQVQKNDRNGSIFADRYLNDYAEIQRLNQLSKKLVEIQQYLKPLKF